MENVLRAACGGFMTPIIWRLKFDELFVIENDRNTSEMLMVIV